MAVLWAIARLTLIAAMRRRMPWILTLLGVLLGPAISMFLEGDATLEGLLKTVLTWNTTLVSAAMVLVVAFFSSNNIGKDISGKELFSVDAKGVHRHQIFLGKWLGIALLAGWLLLIAWGITYLVVFSLSVVGRVTAAQWGLTIVAYLLGIALLALGCWLLLWRLGKFRWWKWAAAAAAAVCLWFMAGTLRAIPVRHDARAADRTAVRERLLVARRPYHPVNLRDPMEIMDDAYERRLAQLRREPTQEELADLRLEILNDSAMRMLRIPWLGSRLESEGVEVHFAGLPTELLRSATEVIIRYRLYLQRDSWGGTGSAEWSMPMRSGYTFQKWLRFKSGAFEDMAVPVSVISEHGRAVVRLVNLNGPIEPEWDDSSQMYRPAATMFLPLREGMHIMIPVGSFSVNLAKGFFLLWVRLATMALVGVALNTFVSGPVCALALAGWVAVGLNSAEMARGIMADLQPWELALAEEEGRSTDRTEFEEIMASAAVWLLSLTPDFEKSDPTSDLMAGREITWGKVYWRLCADLLFRGGLAAALGIWLFTRRELAKPTAT